MSSQTVLQIGDLGQANRQLTSLIALDEGAESLRPMLEKAQRKARLQRLKFLEKEFEVALNAGDSARARTVQQELASLDAESPLYRWLLKKASGRDPGKRPRNIKPLAMGVAALLVLALLVFLFLK